ncbi:hypothetical protein A1O1_08228 [Capronia coronata CBS 617.96]|uniref:AB hydrolase-1 domain-containing protein n=1 Tax=Capronia coronata CBS 617.96 TaxID=1182541 RepID=W9YIN1_9EURO|nr:uncharacterized protein A1O1_08228 [Capronia coronata CBS 617.96]EXJ82159.1 hypothetical protein A1O1_08228 [Capronia coronata CBS 617.96]
MYPPARSPVAHGGQYLSPALQPSTESPYFGGIHDPRSSSTQSLGLVKSASDERRTLLIVYIHGFLGDETSFQSFPAHVHGLLTRALAQTHVVYTKIYPRYKSRENITVARDALSNWLAPHEAESTDIVLVGHSLGGILGAEVVLLPSDNELDSHVLRHRILGLIAFDTPFLGMHPGVVTTGIASLFRAPAQLEGSPPPDPTLFPDPFAMPQDPTYNPSYANDVLLANRKGKIQKAWYFWNKHAGELAKAARNYVSSHLEFGGCLADYMGLRKRYRAIRALEDVQEIMKPRASNGRLMKRVRFVNYYTASTGPVKERPPDPVETSLTETGVEHVKPTSNGSTQSGKGAASASPRLSMEEYRNSEMLVEDIAQLDINTDSTDPAHDSTVPSTDANALDLAASGQNDGGDADAINETALQSSILEQSLGFSQVDGSPKTPKEDSGWDTKPSEGTEGVVEGRMEDDKDHLQAGAEAAKQQGVQDILADEEQSTNLTAENGEEHPSLDVQETHTIKKQKDRKFCALPAKDRQTGERDHTWVRVHMEGIDEVVAHTSLFNIGETYAKLVGDTVERIESWVAEDASTRFILAELDNDI